MFKKLLDKLIPKRHYKQEELATAIIDCFRMEGGKAMRSQSFDNGRGGMLTDSEGNTSFYPMVYVDASRERLQKIVDSLKNGDEIVSPDLIPRVKLFGRTLRNKTLMAIVAEAHTTGMAPEMTMRHAHQNDLSVDLETVTFLLEAMKLQEKMDGLVDHINQSVNLKTPRSESTAGGKDAY